jgi:hypothetical protein
MANEFTKIAIRYPGIYSLVTGAVLGALAIIIGLPLPWGVSLGGAYSAITWFLWRRGGPASRRELDRGSVDDQPIERRVVLLQVIVGLVAAVLGGLLIWRLGR